MKPVLVGPLRLIECITLGMIIVFLCFAIPGGVYEVTTGSPSDTFNLVLLLFGSPVFLILLIGLPLAIWHNVKVRRASRWAALMLMFLIVVIRALQSG